MIREEIIAMAREAGANVMMLLTDPPRLGIIQMHPQHLEKFAALVAAKEREECAKVCLQMAKRAGGDIRTAALEVAAENISARGQ